MAQRNSQIQSQETIQTHSLTQQQMEAVRMLETPISEFEDLVRTKMLDNAAIVPDESDSSDSRTEKENKQVDDILNDREDGESDSAPDSYLARGSHSREEQTEMPLADETTFNDYLTEQLNEEDLAPHMHDLVEYLIGSLDGDGYLRKDLGKIVDELAFDRYIDTTETELEDALRILQGFDPAGIGSRDLRECLLIQLDRQPESNVRNLATTVLRDHFDNFVNHNWDKIAGALGISAEAFNELDHHIIHLNPHPGSALGESIGHSSGKVRPDFQLTVDDDGNMAVDLNWGEVPPLTVSESFLLTMKEYDANKSSMSLQQKNDIAYVKDKVDKARSFIDAVNSRRKTMLSIMKAIAAWQKQFFLDYYDEASLRPLILQNIADQTGYDISTISRVTRDKYVEVNNNKMFPLKYFFTSGITSDDGTEITSKAISQAITEIIDGENKQSPLSDEGIAALLREKGFPVARRTVAKYRTNLRIPGARLRKKL